MTHYEELDVSPAATADEIRHSYKALARLLHPDQCADGGLKRLAELQMRRLNQVLAVLTDPEQSESSGVVKGHYQARYRIPDRAIEPAVSFRFEGASGTPDAQFSWKGPGDADGKVTLRLLAPDQLQVSWTANHLSAGLNLASGIAQLIRQREP